MSEIRFSPDFTLREFTYSETAARMGLEVHPTDEQIGNAQRLCTTLLQPIRTALQKAMVVISGIRPKWLNDSVGGSETSAHLIGCAADVRVVGMEPRAFAHWIRDRGFTVDQVILEFDRWVHIGMAKPGAMPRQQFLEAKKIGGRTVYEELK